nr:glycosyltransferase family 4 protein [Microbacterium bovistercoris]
MKVVQLVCSDGFAGVERWIANTACGLDSSGVEVIVIGGARARMTAALSGTGVTWRPGDGMRQALASLRDAPVPDIVNTHMSQADLVGAVYRLSPSKRHATQVSTRHFMGERGRGFVSRAALGFASRSIGRELAISDAVAQYVGHRVDVVHTGVSPTDIDLPRESYVLVAQRLEPEKATTDAIEAWALSSGPRQGWTMRIAGEGSERSRLADLARERGVSESIEFLGHRDDIPDLLARAGIVFAPTPREGLGILVLEAMAHGTPVIASASGGHLETAGGVVPELMFPPGDGAEGARVIDALIADPAARAHAGAALRARQRERFTIERQVAEIRAAYENVLSR